MRFKFYVLSGLVCLLLNGCAVKVPIAATQEQYTEEPRFRSHSKVVLFIPEQDYDQTFSQQGVVAVGMLLDWRMAVGKAMADSSQHFFENYFTNVEVRPEVYRRGECSDCALAVRPIVRDVKVNKITMQSKVHLSFEIFDSNGMQVVHLPIVGKSKFMTLDRLGVGLVSASVPGVSSLAGNSVLSKSVEDAFADAFWRLHLKMKQNTETGALARNWLPRTLRQKTQYGRYEFAAERAIQSVGCQFPQDGLRLVESAVGELYEAYCWQQEPFLVSCNGSSCDIIYPEPENSATGFALE